MVDRFRQILQIIERDKGAVTLLVLLKMDEFTDKWTIIISAPWTNESVEIFNYLSRVIKNNLTPEESSTIARIGIFPRNEYIVNLFLNYQTDSKITEDTKLNGNVVHEAYIIKSDSNVS